MAVALFLQRDDERRAAISAALRAVPVDVLDVSTAEDAVAFLEAARSAPELVLTDVRLDTGEGQRFAEALRRRRTNARAVYLGGGFVDALSWPLRTYVVGGRTSVHSLVRLVERLLQPPRPNSELSST